MNINNFLKQSEARVALSIMRCEETLNNMKATLSTQEEWLEQTDFLLMMKPAMANQELHEMIMETKLYVSGFYAISVVKLIDEIKAQFCPEFIDKIEINKHLLGWSVFFPDGSDVAIHQGTYGHEDGCFESYRMPQDDGDVTGDLSEKEVVERLAENFSDFILK